MSVGNVWKLQSMDISAIGKAPDIEYVFADDNRSFHASPPGGLILIEAMTEDGSRSRITLTNMLTQEVFALVESQHVDAPSCGDGWSNAAAHAGEIGAALYWSMWRMQQVKARAAEEPRA